MGNNREAILKTLLYADIFNFPLEKKEVWKFLISKDKLDEKKLFESISQKDKFIEFKNGFYFIKGRKELVYLRKKRQKISGEKLRIAKKIIKKISYFPTVKFIGISGALSMQNSDEEDDIDLFVISEKNFVWTTRFILVLSLILMGVYRNKNSKVYKDKICLNMIIDEDNMVLDKQNQNLYTAHEIIQTVPLFEKNNTYKKFIEKNNWYKNFLANATAMERIYLRKKTNYFDFIFIKLLNIIFIEKITRLIQKKYMEKNITKETIKNGFLALHPFDYKSYVLKTYEEKLNKYI